MKKWGELRVGVRVFSLVLVGVEENWDLQWTRVEETWGWGWNWGWGEFGFWLDLGFGSVGVGFGIGIGGS